MNNRPEIKNQIAQRQKLLLKRLPFIFTGILLFATLWFTYLFFARIFEGQASEKNSEQTNRLELDINVDSAYQHLNGSLTPILVSYTHDDLKLIDLGGKVLDRDGKDISFHALDGSALVTEIERYEPFKGRITAWIHINGDILRQNKLSIRYGNSISGDSENIGFGYPYFAVWHMNRNFQSSAAFPLHGEYRKIKDAEGKICGAKEFTASEMASISFDRPSEFPENGSIQISAWVKTHGSDESQFIYSDNNKKGGCALLIEKAGWPVFEMYNGSKKLYVKSRSGIKPDTWYRITAGYDSELGEAYLYLNDRLENRLPSSWSYTKGGRPVIGAAHARCHGFFNGMVDELRLSSHPNNATLIGLQYRLENNPETFFKTNNLSEKITEDLARISHVEAEGSTDYISMRWTGENEQNVGAYFLERAEGNDSFRTVQSCKPGTDLYAAQHYLLIDKDPLPGDARYRISYADKNGRRIAGEPIRVNYTPTANSLSIREVSPNPFRDKFSVTFSTALKESVKVSLTSISGEVVHHSLMAPVESGEQIYQFNGSQSLAPGIYFLSLKQSNHQRTLKMVKRS